MHDKKLKELRQKLADEKKKQEEVGDGCGSSARVIFYNRGKQREHKNRPKVFARADQARPDGDDTSPESQQRDYEPRIILEAPTPPRRRKAFAEKAKRRLSFVRGKSLSGFTFDEAVSGASGKMPEPSFLAQNRAKFEENNQKMEDILAEIKYHAVPELTAGTTAGRSGQRSGATGRKLKIKEIGSGDKARRSPIKKQD